MLKTHAKKLKQKTKTDVVIFGQQMERFVEWSTRYLSVGIVSLMIVNTTALAQVESASKTESSASITHRYGQILVRPQNISRKSLQVPSAKEMLISAAQESPTQEADQARDPVPEATAQRESLKKTKEIFKDSYADRSGRSAFAALLLKTGLETDDSPADQYVLLNEALAIATSSGDVDLTLRAVKAIGERFEVDSNELHLDAFKELFAKSADPADHIMIAASRTLDQLIDADQYAAAKQLVSGMFSVARKKNQVYWQTRLKDRSRLVREFSKSFRSLEREFATLEKNDDDPAANLAIGKFYCFQKGDFSKGLPYLKICDDESLESLSMQESIEPTDTETIKKLADGWWELAEQSDEHQARLIQMHAQTFYAKIIGNLRGLQRLEVQRRLEQGDSISAYSLVAPGTTFEIVWTNEAGRKLKNTLVFDKAGTCKRSSPTSMTGGSWTLEGNVVTVVTLGLPRIEYYTFQNPDTFSCLITLVQPDNRPAKFGISGVGFRSNK